MIQPVIFDFDKIHSLRSFYSACKKQLQLPGYFGDNLDALWDCITAGIKLPAAVCFINITPYHLKKFEKQISLFENAAKELDGAFTFEYHTREDADAG